MDTDVPRHRIIASYLFTVAVVTALIVRGKPDTADEGSLGSATGPGINAMLAGADTGGYDTLPPGRFRPSPSTTAR
jgi:hypothetical protein